MDDEHNPDDGQLGSGHANSEADGTASDDSEFGPIGAVAWSDFLTKCGPDYSPKDLLAGPLLDEKLKVRVGNVTRGTAVVGGNGLVTVTKISLAMQPARLSSKCMTDLVQFCEPGVSSAMASRALWVRRFGCNLYTLAGRVKVSGGSHDLLPQSRFTWKCS